ncbi:tRNA lysidine(34) synthetase TilS [Galbibacter sp. BG1]|uniref:tRNA lysidine(34) synthetase TilS n=1 Tax=Galbibacter sp. BG1 TaxID=1170699 RepID=UPI0015BAA257|nr:tRNA lysidine(34) synthetase TilS [Galbibacter sp. BG1]QLE02553.1 tRNA lysidine(34) synthetase TilS [Galbibacter sp. BG1]
MLDPFKDHIRTHFPFLLTGRLAIASSGGIDSMVLTHLCKENGLDIRILHCNFQLRGEESDKDQQFLKFYAENKAIPFFSTEFNTETYAENHKISTQLAARELRYAWFKEQKDILGFDYLLTGHHLDDNLETFLINLSRGTGIDGLTGIPEVNNYIVRPMLVFSRDEIFQYALKNNIKWREDESNVETKYLRNKIRHEVVPKLKDINPEALQNFQKTISHLKGSSEIIGNHLKEIKSRIFKENKKSVEVSLEELKQLKPKEAYLFHLFSPFGFTEVNDLISVMESQSGKKLFSKTHRLVRDREKFIITPLKKEPVQKDFLIKKEETSITTPINLSIDLLDNIELVDRTIIYVDKEKLKFPLKLRKWKNGDYFYPFGMQGKKKISKFFKDEKFSLPSKENQWLLCDREDKIIWVVGQRADNRFKVTEKTKRILKIECIDA